MPNFVKNKIIIRSKEMVDKLLNEYCTVEDNIRYFDFNKIIEMPKDLEIEFSSRSLDGLKLAITALENKNEIMIQLFTTSNYEFYEEIKNYINVKDYLLTSDQVEEMLNSYKDLSEVISLGAKQISNLYKYKAANWYFWCIENWGTKWNSSNLEYSNNTIKFETAWEPCIPVIIRLSELNPDMKLAYLYSDEEEGVDCGYMMMQNGHIDMKGKFDNFSVDAIKMHNDMWNKNE